jgi:hypothetical protein
MISVLRLFVLAAIGFGIFLILLLLAMTLHNDTLLIIAFVWLFLMWPVAELINVLI